MNVNERFKRMFGVEPELPDDIVRMDGALYETSKELSKAKFRIKPFSLGLMLFNKGRIFRELIELNKRRIKNRIVLSEKSSFLFTCGRKAIKKGIAKKKGNGRFFIATNLRDEVIGIIHFNGKEYSNYANIGSYLKEEEGLKF